MFQDPAHVELFTYIFLFLFVKKKYCSRNCGCVSFIFLFCTCSFFLFHFFFSSFFTPTLSRYHSHSVFCVPFTNLTYMVYSEYSSQFVIYKPACCNTFIFYQHCRALLQLRLNNFVKVKSYKICEGEEWELGGE